MLKIKHLSIRILLMALICAPISLHADTLSIINEPENSPAGVLRPTSGMSMQQVEASYGAPREALPYVGNPPITRWVYKDFTVYFEYEYVVYSVVHR